MTLLGYVGQRVAWTGPVLLSVVTVVFVVVRVLPGDPAQAALGENASSAAVAELRAELGLGAPLPIQYLRFMGDLARGDLGRSMISRVPVRDQIAYNLPFTLELTLVALVVGILVGVPVGVGTAVGRNRLPDYVGRGLSLAGLSTPAFFLGILLIMLFSVQLGWLPAVGGGDRGAPPDLVAHLVLPGLTLGLVMTASVARLTRAAMLGALGQEHVRTARAKGLRRGAVVLRH